MCKVLVEEKKGRAYFEQRRCAQSDFPFLLIINLCKFKYITYACLILLLIMMTIVIKLPVLLAVAIIQDKNK